MVIKILGTGCTNCLLLEKNVYQAVEQFSEPIKIVNVSSIEDIFDLGVMMIPALIINDKIVSAGKALDVDKIVELIKINFGG